jgi:hypothetical protein
MKIVLQNEIIAHQFYYEHQTNLNELKHDKQSGQLK